MKGRKRGRKEGRRKGTNEEIGKCSTGKFRKVGKEKNERREGTKTKLQQENNKRLWK